MIPLDHDIALLELASPVVFDDHIGPIQISTPTTDETLLAPQQIIRAVGWGITDDGQASQDLLYADIEVQPLSTCANLEGYKGKISINMVCAGGDDVDTCNGDSGGGVFSEGTYPPRWSA
ncbi:hypothetical protein D3874_14820 [Oleomonas cavernae]|uniref:Peptidase S1 domain-containing protein n=1 Tax=Oleomonas cavernae TaxID=2320859 RepID=A0A418WDM3_9PROT|nr:hypothetical protein D3874_14820 [Oleomonas cavernae]